MKTLHCSLLALLLASNSTFAADLLYRQTFETPIANNPEIQWVSPGYAVTQAQIGDDPKTAVDDPKEGSKSIRGNFNEKVIDPISGVRGNPFVQFKINFAKVPALKNWYPTDPPMYVSWWFKLDKCHWKGTESPNTDPLKVAGKLAYIRMNEDPATSYYFTMEGSNTGKGTFSVNDGTWMKMWEKLYDRGAIYLSNNVSFGSDGKWHQLSFYIDKNKNGQKYLMWWIDNKLMQADRFEPDGKHPIVNEFILDSIQFWHTKSNVMDLTEGSCNGWQIDDVQVWNDIPEKPFPPRRQVP